MAAIPVTSVPREERIITGFKQCDDHLTKLMKICLINMFLVGKEIKCKNESESEKKRTKIPREERIRSSDKLRDDHLVRLMKICIIL